MGVVTINGPMFWIGGTPGSGKSTIARRLAHELDLPLHPIDAYTYDHVARVGDLGLALDDVLAQGPAAAADDFERISALRLPVVVDDVRDADVGEIPTLVEGPQLHPDALAVWEPIGSVWLLTTAQRTREAREDRLVEGDEAARSRVEHLVQRDQELGKRLGAAAAREGLPVVDVPTDVRWDVVDDAVRAAVVAGLAGRPRLRPGPELAARRRHENDVVHRQLSAHERHIKVVLPPFPYACICGNSGCDNVRSVTTVNY